MQHLRELVRFLPALETPNFKAGEIHGPEQTAPGRLTMPYVDYGEVASEFIKAGYDHGWVVPGFDWPEWAQTTEAQELRDDKTALARATPEQIARLLTVLIRQDRFCDGVLLDAFDSGLILRIVRRAAAIVEAGDDPSRA